jgi:hypothetical protein
MSHHSHATLLGNATYATLCRGGSDDTGTNACKDAPGGGDCFDDQLHLAWPDVTTVGCNDSCAPLCPRACGEVVQVTNACTSQSVRCMVLDCSPARTQEGCNHTPRCADPGGGPGTVPYPDSSYGIPLCQLTTGAFMSLNGRLADGRLPVQVTC